MAQNYAPILGRTNKNITCFFEKKVIYGWNYDLILTKKNASNYTIALLLMDTLTYAMDNKSPHPNDRMGA